MDGVILFKYEVLQEDFATSVHFLLCWCVVNHSIARFSSTCIYCPWQAT